jgi:hypothetical protein
MKEEKDKIIPITLGFKYQTDIPNPFLIQTERSAFLLINVSEAMISGGIKTGGVAVLEFKDPLLTKFGYPNDEALGGHPLIRRGLNYYTAQEVLSSSWVEAVNAQNNVVFPKSDIFSDKHHYILSFHDTTFEIIANGFQLIKICSSLDEARKEAVERSLI